MGAKMTTFNTRSFSEYKSIQRKITMITAYDYHSAQILSNAKIDVILVGDSLGMVVQGKTDTLSVTLEEIIYHAKNVRRGAPDAFMVVDMPYLTYHTDLNNTIRNAGLLISRGGANAVKLEINHMNTLNHIEALVAAQIPVIAHIGMTPQSVNLFGGFKLQGKTLQQANHISQLAIAAENSGAIACVIECVPEQIAAKITKDLTIPTIGIGAGLCCDGQVLVYNDLLGLTENKPKFVKKYLNARELFTEAVARFMQDVQAGEYPAFEHSFK